MKANTVVKAQRSSYKTWVDEGDNLRVQNTENALFKIAPKNHTFRVTEYKFEDTATAFKQAWGMERLKYLNEKSERISMVYYLSPQGKILEIEFVIQGTNTLITIDEVEILERILKENLSIPLIWENSADEADFAFQASALPFKLILSLLEGETKVGRKITHVILTPPPLPDHLK